MHARTCPANPGALPWCSQANAAQVTSPRSPERRIHRRRRPDSVYEMLDEDPLLVPRTGATIKQGIQRPGVEGEVPARAAACMKHFIGYSVVRLPRPPPYGPLPRGGNPLPRGGQPLPRGGQPLPRGWRSPRLYACAATAAQRARPRRGLAGTAAARADLNPALPGGDHIFTPPSDSH